MRQQRNLIMDLSFSFALDIIRYSEQLEEKRKYIIARQVLAAGTSIGANVREAQHAESRKDFIHKMKIASKEAEEINYWLQLCNASKNYPSPFGLFKNLENIQRILTKIIISSKNNPKLTISESP